MLIRIEPSPITGSPSGMPDVTPLRRKRRSLTLLLVLLLLLLLLLLRWNNHRAPASLEQAVLTGPRGPQCLRLVIAEDVSGSMSEYSAARAQAITALLTWAPGQLRADDELAVVTFAASATTRMQPTPVGQKSSPVADAPSDGVDTLLTPVVDAAATFPETSCHTHLLVVGDGLISDPVEAGDLARLSASGIDSVGLLMPSPDLHAPEEFRAAFPYAQNRSFDGTDADQTGLALAQVLATQTEQTIERR